MINVLKRVFALLAVSLLASCGGGGGDTSVFGGDAGSGGGTGGGTTPTVTASDLVLVLSSSTIANDGTQPVTATATALDGNRVALANVPVTISVDSGAIATASGSVTGTGGTFTASISIGSNRSNRTINVTARSGNLTRTAALNVADPVPGGTTAPTIALAISSTTVTAASPITVSATVKSSSGAPAPGRVVTFSTVGGLGRFSVNTALTNESGVATVNLSPTTASTAGADTVVATTTVNDTIITTSVGFQLTATNVTITSFASDVGGGALSPYGQTTLSVALSAGAAGTPVSISLSSSCVSRGLATLTPSTATTSTGSATFTYRDNGCGADRTDTVQASLAGTSQIASLQLTLTAPAVASVSFVSASPETIFLRGSGFVENSTVTFAVRDAAGNGVRGQTVQLTPTTLAGGLKVDDQSSGFPISKQTDLNGNVVVRVNSGTVPTPVRIRASLTVNGVEISTVSSTLAIAVGLPSESNFSLSQRAINIEGYNRDGTSNTYTIIASDRLGNPVPDGTAINFITEGGQIQATRQTATVSGLSSATANFQTASPVPRDGRVTVLAYALGEESFLDVDGNNVYTPGSSEPFQDLGDPYIDRLFNGFFGSAPNQFIPQTPSGASACLTQSPLLALGVGAPSRPATCNGEWGRAYVRKATETIFSTSSARPTWGTALPAGASAASNGCPSPLTLTRPNAGNDFPAYDASGVAQQRSYYVFGSAALFGQPGAGTLILFASDANPEAFNPVAAGTTVSVTSTDGLTASVAGGSPIPSTSSPTGVAINYNFEGATSGVITVSFSSPAGLISSFSQSISISARPAGFVACP